MPAIFESRFAFVDTVDVTSAGVGFALHPRKDGGAVSMAMEVLDERDGIVVKTDRHLLDASKRWRVAANLWQGRYLVKIELEGCLAYEAESLVDDIPFYPSARSYAKRESSSNLRKSPCIRPAISNHLSINVCL
jgi:hypothetical protein